VKSRSKILALAVAVCLFSSGCSTNPAPQSSAQGLNQKSGWNCKSGQDGLGEDFYCASEAEDTDGNYWSLSVMCTSDQLSKHSIVGIYPDRNSIKWPIGKNQFVKIRVDSQPIQEWQVSTKSGGEGLFFFDGDRFNGSNSESLESNSTWRFLTSIAGAKTFGFKATDSEGDNHSLQFNVENSIPIAAKFGVLGCKNV
jgi:hypothetical protein